jgi:thioredoxin 1
VFTLKVGKINVDEQQELAAEFKVMSIPTLAVVKGGVVVKKAVGAKSKADILDLVAE